MSNDNAAALANAFLDLLDGVDAETARTALTLALAECIKNDSGPYERDAQIAGITHALSEWSTRDKDLGNG